MYVLIKKTYGIFANNIPQKTQIIAILNKIEKVINSIIQKHEDKKNSIINENLGLFNDSYMSY